MRKFRVIEACPVDMALRALAALAAALAAACSSSPAADGAGAYDGSWSGAGDASGVPMHFKVADNKVSDFVFSAAFGNCSNTYAALPNAPIAADKFGFGLSSNGVSTYINGAFIDEMDATGSFGTLSLSLQCGTSFVSGSASGEPWHAMRQ